MCPWACGTCGDCTAEVLPIANCLLPIGMWAIGVFFSSIGNWKSAIGNSLPWPFRHRITPMDLFQESRQKNLDRVAPLAARMRPRTLDEFVGQQHFLGEGKLLRRMLEADRLTSVIFYGPPGTGKTTLAQLIAQYTKS